LQPCASSDRTESANLKSVLLTNHRLKSVLPFWKRSMIKRFFLPEVLTGTSKYAVSFSGSVPLQLLGNLFDSGWLCSRRSGDEMGQRQRQSQTKVCATLWKRSCSVACREGPLKLRRIMSSTSGLHTSPSPLTSALHQCGDRLRACYCERGRPTRETGGLTTGVWCVSVFRARCTRSLERCRTRQSYAIRRSRLPLTVSPQFAASISAS